MTEFSFLAELSL